MTWSTLDTAVITDKLYPAEDLEPQALPISNSDQLQLLSIQWVGTGESHWDLYQFYNSWVET